MTWNSQEVLKKECWEIDEVEFPEVIKKKSCDGVSIVSLSHGFWPWIYKGCHTILQNFHE